MTVDRIFGTDGIRDIANYGYLSAEFLVKLGKFIGLDIIAHLPKKRVIIGQDSRASGSMIESALSAGLLASGADVADAGIISTPGLAFLTRQDNFGLGIMISASHNPCNYNGIKLFASDGAKVSHDLERKIEQHLKAISPPSPKNLPVGFVIPVNHQELIAQYIDYIIRIVLGRKPSNWLRGMKIVIDCANGATSEIAPALFAKLGATVLPINNKPDGKNINHHCGSLHPEALRRKVIATKADIGFSLDGDGDRLIMVDDKGIIRDGDHVLFIAARHMHKRGRLKNYTVVGTIMTNSALEFALAKDKIKLVRTSVGDKYVLAQMLKDNYAIGGEPSGHIIFSDYSKNGDGLLTALAVLKIIKAENKSLSELIGSFKLFPQLIVNVPIKSKPPLDQVAPIQQKVKEIESKVGKEGRLNLRYSGTEYLARIMIEGQSLPEIKSLAESLAKVVKTHLKN